MKFTPKLIIFLALFFNFMPSYVQASATLNDEQDHQQYLQHTSSPPSSPSSGIEETPLPSNWKTKAISFYYEYKTPLFVAMGSIAVLYYFSPQDLFSHVYRYIASFFEIKEEHKNLLELLAEELYPGLKQQPKPL